MFIWCPEVHCTTIPDPDPDPGSGPVHAPVQSSSQKYVQVKVPFHKAKSNSQQITSTIVMLTAGDPDAA